MSSADPLRNNLKIILGSHVEGDIVDYISSMKHEEDLDEFMENILDRNNSAHLSAYEAIRRIIFGKKSTKQVVSSSRHEASMHEESTAKSGRHSKGKKKFSDINTFQEKKKQKQGRIACDCEGQEHDFMNNCLTCGRIHCIEEGPGPCFYCGEHISVIGDEMFNVNSRKVTTRHKENKVFDDDNDFFKSKDATKHTNNHKKLVVALDFATRKIIESTEEDLKIKDKLHKDIKQHLDNVDKLYRKLQKQSEMNTVSDRNNDLVDLLIQMRHKKPAGEEDLGIEDNAAQIIDYGRVYDEDVITSTDHALCMSMHQPYASLLVAGVKKHEGRTWKTNHRGRLWIAAASKVPDEDEIAALEDFYRHYYDDHSLKFPRDYPTSCLLGCVFVEDCLDQGTYRKQYPSGESDSPYVLICSNPVILPIFYPIVGQHKIYPLDKELHNCAKLSIRHAKYGLD